MKKLIGKRTLSLNDLILVPQYSAVESVDIYCYPMNLELPMVSIVEPPFTRASVYSMFMLGGLSILGGSIEMKNLPKYLESLPTSRLGGEVLVGDTERLSYYLSLDIGWLVIDSLNPNSLRTLNFVEKVRTEIENRKLATKIIFFCYKSSINQHNL